MASALVDPAQQATANSFTIELERESDGRWLAEVIGLPGAMAYGSSPAEAVGSAKALAFRALADRIEHHEALPAAADNLFSLK